jgi:hypothetical protein
MPRRRRVVVFGKRSRPPTGGGLPRGWVAAETAVVGGRVEVTQPM